MEHNFCERDQLTESFPLWDGIFIRGLQSKIPEEWEMDQYSLHNAIELMVYDLNSSERHFICPTIKERRV